MKIFLNTDILNITLSFNTLDLFNADALLGTIKVNGYSTDLFDDRIKIDVLGSEVVFGSLNVRLKDIEVGKDILAPKNLNIAYPLLKAFLLSVKFHGGATTFIHCETSYPRWGKNTLFFFDLDSLNYVKKEYKHKKLNSTADGVFLCSHSNIIKVGQDLEVVWESPDLKFSRNSYHGSYRASYVTPWRNSRVFFNGRARTEVRLDNPDSDFCDSNFKDGTLYCLDDLTGAKIWLCDFEYAIDDFLIHNNKIVVYTFNQIHILNADSGETEHIIDNGRTRTIYKACARPPELFVVENFLYMPWHDDSCIFVYRLSDYGLEGVIDLPAGNHVKQWQLHDEETGQIYVILHNRNEGFDFHRESLLQFHPNEIGQPVEIEQGPKTQITLKPCDNGKQSLWVEMESPSLDDALRFGELHTQNHAFIHGHSQIDRNPPTEGFNGQVHFILTGCQAPEAEIREKLDIMQKRFNLWADKEGIIAGDHSRDCELFVSCL